MTDHIVEANKKVIDLDALEKLADAATPGEWSVSPGGYLLARLGRIGVWGGVEVHGGIQESFDKPNAAFIAAANPATILDLIASARRDAEEIERLRAFAGRMIELVGTAFYDGFRDAIDREKWDDCYDYAAVKGSDYARDAVQKLTARAAHTGEG